MLVNQFTYQADHTLNTHQSSLAKILPERALLSLHKVVLAFVIVISVLLTVSPVHAANVSKEESERFMQEGLEAYNSKMYGYSVTSFEKALEYNRSNYEAMLYLARVNYHLKDYPKAIKAASSLVSSFYPTKEVKIEGLKLLASIHNKKNQPWRALAYLHAASGLSTSTDLSYLVDDQIKVLDFASLDYESFSADNNSVITSKNMMFNDGEFTDVSVTEKFKPVSFQSKVLKAGYVVIAGFDERLRFNKLLVLRLRKGVKPKLLDVPIMKRRRGGSVGAKDLYLKIMDWNFDSYPDLVVRVGARKSDKKQSFLLYNPKSGEFDVDEELSTLIDPILDVASKAVLEESCPKREYCVRKRYKLFNKKFSLAQFEKNVCTDSCMYTKSEIDVSSLRSTDHMYLVSTIHTEFENLKSKFKSKSGKKHTIVTRRLLKAYYSQNFDIEPKEKPIMMLDLDGSWEFPSSYVKGWVGSYFSPQPLDGQLTVKVDKDSKRVVTKADSVAEKE